jgi:hypothetical protein
MPQQAGTMLIKNSTTAAAERHHSSGISEHGRRSIKRPSEVGR